MDGELWAPLARLFYAAGLGMLASLAAGLVLVPYFRRRQFVSRESKEGVRQGRRDTVPMGGGFILLVGVTIAVLTLTAFEQIRRGFTACFLIALWGFALLGYLDDRSKVRAVGYSDKAKIALQLAVTGLFAVSFWWYAKQVASVPDVGLVALPFVGHLPLGIFYVPFVMLFLFYVSNAINITDGFDGLSGGVGAVITAGYAVVTFLIGAAELQSRGAAETEVMRRMFALSLISASLAGSLVAYLYFNFSRGLVYFGDTGSMALGAAIAFLALFSRTEFLLVIIGGVPFVEAASAAMQRFCIGLQKRLLQPALAARIEYWRPLVMAPLHHHFEHLLQREAEDQSDPEVVRRAVRRRLTLAAWKLGIAFAVLGVAAQYGHYREWDGVYDWCCVAGLLLIIAVLGFAVLTRLRFDCYFMAPDPARPDQLILFRGLPLRLGRRPFCSPYETRGVPADALGSVGARGLPYRLYGSRVDARLAFGLAHFAQAQRLTDAPRRAALSEAVRLWEQVPLGRYLLAERQPLLESLAESYRELGRLADAARVLELLYRSTGQPRYAARIDDLQAEALAAAEAAYAAWRPGHDEAARRSALAAHRELLGLASQRRDRLRQMHDLLAAQNGAPSDEQRQLDAQLALLEEAVAVAEERCRRLQPETEAAP